MIINPRQENSLDRVLNQGSRALATIGNKSTQAFSWVAERAPLAIGSCVLAGVARIVTNPPAAQTVLVASLAAGLALSQRARTAAYDTARATCNLTKSLCTGTVDFVLKAPRIAQKVIAYAYDEAQAAGRLCLRSASLCGRCCRMTSRNYATFQHHTFQTIAPFAQPVHETVIRPLAASASPARGTVWALKTAVNTISKIGTFSAKVLRMANRSCPTLVGCAATAALTYSTYQMGQMLPSPMGLINTSNNQTGLGDLPSNNLAAQYILPSNSLHLPPNT